MRLKHFIALLGFAVLVVGYAASGAFERLYFYYAYKLDSMTGGSKITPGCKDCGFNTFIQHIQNSGGVSITAEEFPSVKQTAAKLIEQGHTGRIDLRRIVSEAETYSTLFQRVGAVVQGRMSADLTGRQTPERFAELVLVKKRVFEAMKRAFNSRVETSVFYFEPYRNFKVIADAQGTAVDFERTVTENPGGTTRQRLEELWAQHVRGKPATKEAVRSFRPFKNVKAVPMEGAAGRVDIPKTLSQNPGMTRDFLRAQWKENISGGHRENIEALQTSIEEVRQILCSSGGSKRSMISRGISCFWENQFAAEKKAMSALESQGKSVISTWQATPEEIQAARMAERVSAKEFRQLINKNELSKVPMKKWNMRLSKARSDVLKYKPLEPKSPRLRAGSSGVSMKALGAVGSVMWVEGVVEAFVHDVSTLDRIAAITAIIPFVGCAAGTMAKVENKQGSSVTGIDAALCLIGDSLIMGGFAPLGFVVHLSRLIVQMLIPPPEPPSKEEMLIARDKTWREYLNKRVYSYIYAHTEIYKTHNFASKLEMALEVEAMAVLSKGAQEIGALRAGSRMPYSGLEIDQQQLQAATKKAVKRIREATSAEIIRRQREYLLGLPVSLKDDSIASLTATASQYNMDFIKKITSHDMIRNYPEAIWGVFFRNVVEGYVHDEASDPLMNARKHMDQVAQYLRNIPLPMPRLLDVSFVLGQSKGLKIRPKTLSPRDYLKDYLPGSPTAYIDMLAIRHTIGVVKVIAGNISESELPDLFPVQDDKIRLGLQVLIALKCGKLVERTKAEMAHRLGHHYPPGHPKRGWILRPYIPPAALSSDRPSLIGLILGLTEVVISSRIDDSSNGVLEQQTAEIKRRFESLQEKVKDMAVSYKMSDNGTDFHDILD